MIAIVPTSIAHARAFCDNCSCFLFVLVGVNNVKQEVTSRINFGDFNQNERLLRKFLG
jgi:hypothetical protein